MKRLVVLLLAAVILPGNLWKASAFTGAVLDQVNEELTFEAVEDNPGEYLGETLMVGGKVLSVSVSGTRMRLNMAYLPLDDMGRPAPEQSAEGCFVAFADTRDDVGRFRQGELLTVIGTVTGKTVITDGVAEQTCPTLQVKEAEEPVSPQQGYTRQPVPAPLNPWYPLPADPPYPLFPPAIPPDY